MFHPMRNQTKYEVLTVSHWEFYHLYIGLSLASCDSLACASFNIIKCVQYCVMLFLSYCDNFYLFFFYCLWCIMTYSTVNKQTQSPSLEPLLEKTLESPLDCKEIKAVNSKGDQSWIFIGRTDAEAETPILQPPDGKNWLTGKTLILRKIEDRRRRGQ